MSTEHKAFIFDYDTFIQELAVSLMNSLSIGNNSELISFIENNLEDLRNPDEGNLLDSSWKQMIEIEEVSQYGDFAITKYYNPQCDIGLGYGWELLEEFLSHKIITDVSPVLGVAFGPPENYFDSGKLGSFFQSPELVRKNLEMINLFSTETQNFIPNLFMLKTILLNALTLKKGLYITF